MTIIEKIKQSVECATGMPFLYHAAGELNELIARCGELPVAYSFLIDSGTIDDVNGRYHERVTLAVMFCDKTEFDFNALENEQIIDRMKVKAYKWMQSLRMSNVLRVVSVNNTQRLYDNTTDILTGFAVNITIEDVAGVGECELPQVVIDVDKNGSYDVVGVDKVRVNVVPKLEELEITENGEYLPPINITGFSKVLANVLPKTTDLVATENDKEYLPADYGVDAFRKVKTDIKEAEEKEVNFYDYKGKRVFSYSASEAMALTELPVCPSDEFAEFLQWTEDLETVKMGLPLDMGACYICPDGWHGIVLIDTRLKDRYNKTVECQIGRRYTGNTIYLVNWGDGSEEQYEYYMDGSLLNISHTYDKVGQYIIKCKRLHEDFDYKDSTIIVSTNEVVKQIHVAESLSFRNMSYPNMEYYSCPQRIAGGAGIFYQSGVMKSLKHAVGTIDNIDGYGDSLIAPSCRKLISPTTAKCSSDASQDKVILAYNKDYFTSTWHEGSGTYLAATIILPTALNSIPSIYKNWENYIFYMYSPIPPIVGKSFSDKVIVHIPIGSIGDYQLATNLGTATFIEDIPTAINSFSITADDVAADATTTTIHVKANLSMGAMYDDTMVPRDLERDVTSDAFEANTTGQPRQVTISFTMLGETRTCTITQGT